MTVSAFQVIQLSVFIIPLQIIEKCIQTQEGHTYPTKTKRGAQ